MGNDYTNPNDESNEGLDIEPSLDNERKKPAPIDDATAKELSDHHKALMAEFELVNEKLSASSEHTDIKNYWKGKQADACAQIAWLAMHANSEGVRLNANKYILAEAYAETQSTELEEILKSLVNKERATSKS